MKDRTFDISKIPYFFLILLLLVTTIFGVLSINLNNSYQFLNQYGDMIQIYGSGIYEHDSFFKAPIFIGTDFTMLFLVIPVLIFKVIKADKLKTIENQAGIFSLLFVVLYYSASIVFGITYNNLFLIYLFLFALSFYMSVILFLRLYKQDLLVKKLCTYEIPKGLLSFFYVSAIALFVAWFPDIVSAMLNNSSLSLIEVYTTEITYIFDMGIISPLILLTAYLIKKHEFIGYILAQGILKLCSVIGIMLPVQTVFQLVHGIEIPFAALITKMLLFVVLSLFAVYFDRKLKGNYFF